MWWIKAQVDHLGDGGLHLQGAHVLASPTEGVPGPVLEVEPAVLVHREVVARPEAVVALLPHVPNQLPLVRVLGVHICLELSWTSPIACNLKFYIMIIVMSIIMDGQKFIKSSPSIWDSFLPPLPPRAMSLRQSKNATHLHLEQQQQDPHQL